MSRVFVVAFVVALALGVGVVALSGSGSEGYRVVAEFEDLGGVRKEFVVRSGGTKVGTVKEVDVTRAGLARVELELDPSAVPVGDGAAAEVRPANLLGEKFIELHRGDLSRPWATGGSIPARRTARSVELDEILDMLAPDVRTRLAVLINETGIAVAGRGTDLNGLLRDLPSSLTGARRVLAQLRTENAKLGELIEHADRAAGPVDTERRQAARFVQEAGAVLDDVSRKRHALAATVREAPGALRQISSSLIKITTLTRRLEPAAVDLERTAQPLETTLAALPGFSKAADRPLRTARVVAADLRRLGTAGTPHIRRLQPTAARLADFVTATQPVVETLGRAGGLDGVFGILSNWSNTAKYEDGISRYFDFHVSVSERLLTDGIERLAAAGQAPAARSKAPRRPRLPAKVGKAIEDALGGGTDSTGGAPKKTLPKLPEVLEEALDLQRVLGDLVKPPAAAEPRPGRSTETLLDFLLGE